MNTIARGIKKAVLTAVGAITIMMGTAAALELSDVHMPMTRDDADATLSKDYSYTVLTDGSVRRTWKLEGKQVLIDFDTVTNDAVMVAIVYERPVSKKKGIEDAHTLASGKYDEKASWDAPKDRTAKTLVEDTYGLKNARRKKLDDNAMLFYEMDDKKNRIVRVSLFSRMPATNRWALNTLMKNSGKTALGNQMGASFIDSLYKDEEQRKEYTPKKPKAEKNTDNEAEDNSSGAPTISVTVTQKPTPKPKPAPKPTPEVKKTQTTAPEVTPPASKPTPAQGTVTRVKVPVDDAQREEPGQHMVSLLPPAPTWLQSVGIEEPTWWHYLGLAFVALLLAVFGIRSVMVSSGKAAQRKRFVDVVAQGNKTPSRSKIKRR